MHSYEQESFAEDSGVHLFLDIITITRDDPGGLKSTLESTASLRRIPGVRQIVIDGSSGESRKQSEVLALSSESAAYTWQEPSGIASAFNRGLDRSAAEWVWFINSGDRFHPDMDCTTLLDILRKSSAEALIFQIETKSSHTRYQHPAMWEIWPPVGSWIPHPATIARRRLFEQYGNFDEQYRIAMDYEMWLRLFSNQVIVDLISMPVVIYDETGVSSTRLSESARETRKIFLSKSWMLVKRWLYSGRMILRAFREYQRLSRLP